MEASISVGEQLRVFVKIVLVLIVVLLSISSSGMVSISYGMDRPGTVLAADVRAADGIIQVDSNIELASLMSSKGWPGTGTALNPYIIEDQTIDATGHGAGIYIGNTTAYLIIRDCHISGANLFSDPYFYAAGIDLYNVRNCTLSCNYCSSCVFGLVIDYSNGNTVKGNNMSGNAEGGIYSRHSNGNVYSDNNCSSDNYDGIKLVDSKNNGITGNTCLANRASSISIGEDSDNNIIHGNRCYGTEGYSIYLWYADHGLITNNICNGFTLGIYLQNSMGSTVRNNTCNDNTQAGIWLYYADANILLNNSCSDIWYGIYMDRSNQNIISYNKCNESTYGFYATYSDCNKITNNTIHLNAGYGIDLRYPCNNNYLYGNILTNNNGATSIFSTSHRQANDVGGNQWNCFRYGNHWGDWTSPDVDMDSIVDTPYAINGGGNQDQLPLVDKIVPDITITYPDQTFYTNLDSIIMTGTATEAYGIASITWYNGATHAYGPCTGTGTWSCVVPLVPGENDITANMTDVMSNVLTDNVTVICDKFGPSMQIFSPVDGSYNSTGTVEVTWSGYDGLSGMDHYIVGLDGGTSFRLDATETSWSFGGLDDGEHTVSVTLFDRAGNTDSDEVSFTVRTVGPSVTVNPVEPLFTNLTHIGLSVHATAVVPMTTANSTRYANGILVERLDLTSYFTGLLDATYAPSFSLQEGTNVLYITINDSIGNEGTVSHTTICDLTAPAVGITSPTTGSNLSTCNVTVSWVPGATISGVVYYNVSIDGSAPLKLSNAILSHTFVGLTNGQHSVSVTVVNRVNNRGTNWVNFSVDAEAPTLTITSPLSNEYLNKSNVHVRWSASDNVAIASLEVRIDNGPWQALDVTNTSATFSNLAEGEHIVDVRAKDAVGNAVVRSVTFGVDTIAPSATVSPTGDEVALDAIIIVHFSDVMNVTSVQIEVSDVSGTLIWVGDNATFVPSRLDPNRQYCVNVTGQDWAGNGISLSWFINTTMIGSIHGLVIDASHTAVFNATVTLSNGMTTTTDAYGNFYFTDVPAGSYNITIHRGGFADFNYTIQVLAGNDNDIGIFNMVQEKAGTDNGIFGQPMVQVIVIAVIVIVFICAVTLYLRGMKKP